MAKGTWIRYRSKWSSGSDEWNYQRFHASTDVKEDIEEFIREERDSYYWSEQFRGIEYDILDSAPPEQLLKLIVDTAERIKASEKYFDELSDEYELLTKTGKYSPDNACPECGAPLRSPVGGGVACTQCDYWFCW